MKNLALLATVANIAAYMSETAETVLIKGGKDGPVRVNKSDFDADQAEGGAKSMTLHTNKAANEANDTAIIDQAGSAPQLAPGLEIPPAPSAPSFVNNGNPVAPSQPSPNQPLVSKVGKKFMVVDNTGAPLTKEGIDPKGYDSDAAAWAAIMALPH